MDESSFQD